jgi:hypothetical protein
MVGSVKSVHRDFFEFNESGESPFYFALRFKRWELLKQFSVITALDRTQDQGKVEDQPNYIKVALAAQNYKKPSDVLLKFLMEKARQDDIDFFKPFFELGMDKFFSSDLYDAKYLRRLSAKSLQNIYGKCY